MAGLNPFSTSLVILQECDITFLRGVMRHSQTCRRLVTKNEKIVCDPQTKSCWRLASCWESFRLSRHPTQRAYRDGRPIPGTRRRRRYGAWPGVHTGILQLRVDLSVVCRCHTCGARLGHTMRLPSGARASTFGVASYTCLSMPPGSANQFAHVERRDHQHIATCRRSVFEVIADAL